MQQMGRGRGEGEVCVSCGAAVAGMVRSYTHSSIRLERCARCGRVADKYTEYEVVLVMLDLVIHRIAAWRHILFNRQPFCALPAKQLCLLWMAILAVLTHVKMAMLQLQTPASPPSSAAVGAAALCEFVVFFGAMSCYLVCHHMLFLRWQQQQQQQRQQKEQPAGVQAPSGRTTLSRKMCKVWFALAVPELMWCFTAFAMIWDQQQIMFACSILLILSLQRVSLLTCLAREAEEGGRALSHTEQHIAVVGLVLAHVLRFVTSHLTSAHFQRRVRWW